MSPLAPPSPVLLADPDTSPGPFEGPEKLLEIWFAPSVDALPDIPESSLSGSLRTRHARISGETEGDWRGLRKVPRSVWEEMLDIVKCKVLSVVEGDEIDAYLLSESSLFVAPHLLILKTCGTTLNLLGLYRIIEIAREYCGYTTIWRCFYSRKSFFFPERQHGIHKDWRHEVNFLDSVFGSAGSAYTVGPMNRDHWLLYLTSPNSRPLLPSDSFVPLPPTPVTSSAPTANLNSNVQNTLNVIPPLLSTSTKYQDQTLEILMSYLSPQAREPFFHPESTTSSLGEPRSGHELGHKISTTLGIDQLFPSSETTLDSFGFEPCGYSANAVIGTGMPESVDQQSGGLGGGYFTIHVTPEEGWSYASFECNVPLPLSSSNKNETSSSRPTLQELIRNVVNIFQPNRLSITLFVSTAAEEKTTPAEAKAWQAIAADLLGTDFERKDRIGYEFDGYDLVFGCFERRGWVEPQGNGVEGRKMIGDALGSTVGDR